MSFKKLEMFLKERRRNLRFFVDATTEVAASDDDVDMDGEVDQQVGADDDVVMSPEENLALSDDEEVFSDDDEEVFSDDNDE